MFNSKIFQGVIPGTLVNKGKGQKREGKGEGCVVAAREMDALLTSTSPRLD